MSSHARLLLVVMGVSGCGKSTFSKALSDEFGLILVDGDDLHSPASVAKMQAGIALDDGDRWPWLDRIAMNLASSVHTAPNQNGKVIACSALKRAYRDRIRGSVSRVTFIFLDGSSELIRKRMSLRTGHFMQPDLLDSQLHALERPAVDEKDVVTLNTALSIPELVKEVKVRLQKP
jgi:gluconokinase